MENRELLFSDDIGTFLDEHGVREDCPFCANDHWLLEPDISTTPISAAIYSMANANGKNRYQPSYQTVVMTCSKCGFVRFQDAEAIKRWKREKQASQAPSEVSDGETDGNNN